MADKTEETVEETTSSTTTKSKTTKSKAKVQSTDAGIAAQADTESSSTPTVTPTVDAKAKATLLYGAETEVVDLGFANPTKENKEFSVDFVAKANPAVFTADVVKAVKTEFAK